MDPSIKAIQDSLDSAARAILRYVSTNKNKLTPVENATLAKFMFGCMNQKFNIASRVDRYGSGEIEKVLEFIGKASEAMLRVDERLNKEEGR